jgi:hypothetical protein
MTVRQLIKAIVVSKHFMRGSKDEDMAASIIEAFSIVLMQISMNCKFEENIDGNLVFRAKRARSGTRFSYQNQRVESQGLFVSLCFDISNPEYNR